jgi:dienelactone hydrolase
MLHLCCPRRRSLTLLTALVAISVSGLWLSRDATPAQPAGGKRPLTQKDFDSWRSIQGPQLSPDGRFVAYTLVPQEGDTELVVRHLESGKEVRHSRGRTAAPGAGGKGAAAPAGPPAAGKVAFTADSKFLVFSIAPAKADQPEPPKKGAPAPKSSLGIVNLTNGKITVIPDVRSFQVPEDAPGALVYHKSPPDAKKAESPAKDEEDDDQPKKGGGKQPQPAVRPTPSDLVIHVLADGFELTITDVTDYTLARDSSVLVCALAAKDGTGHGVYAFYPTKDKEKLVKQSLLLGKAKYSRLTWDEKQRFVAFFAERGGESEPGAAASGSAAATPQLSLYVADRAGEVVNRQRRGAGSVAVEVVSGNTSGFKDGMVLSDRGALSFSDDGMRLFFGVAPPPVVAKDAGKDKAVVELWHWNDGFIQPMQKARAAQEKNHTYRAVAHLKERKVVQLADKAVPEVTPSPNGRYALGFDDQPYRSLVAYDSAYSDWYLIDTLTGSRKPLVKKHHWGVSWSPHGRYALFFDGKDWNTVSVPEGTVTNLTKSLGGKFSSEDHDTPNAPQPYGFAGWTSDEYFVLLYDKYDIWKVEARGGGYEKLTGGKGRAGKIQFRYVKLRPKEKSIDPSKPMLLRAENLETRDSGFYALDPRAAPPQQLIMQPCNFGTPILARDADVFVVTASTFSDFPNLYVTKSSFKLLSRISDANPQQKELLWGKAEMIHYTNADGVRLSAVLIKPENFDPNKKYPMIVYIYEKLSQNLHRFVDPQPGTSINPSYYASNGYLVLMPDIVYTVGYPGQSAMKCVLPAIQAVADQGFVNEQAIGIQGHSWGGYQVAYLITQTTRFKAAAAGAPVSNMTSAYGGIRWGSGLPRQWQYEKAQSRIGGTLWEFPLRYIENSPVFMADRVKTPLMILHNDQDDAVPWYQGVEYYLALRRLGKEVYLFNYPGEKHGLTKRVNQMDYTMRMKDFFDYHLKGGAMPEWMANGIPYTPPPGMKEMPPKGPED